MIEGLYNVKDAKFSTPADNYITHSKNYGEQIERWNGVDVTVNARLPFGLRIQGGTSTGRLLTDNCEIREKLPQISPTNPWCRVDEGFNTTFTGFASYIMPKVDVLMSITWQDRPSRVNPIQANYTATNAYVKQFLGRDLSGGSSSISVPLIDPWSVKGERLRYADVRFGKVIRVGKVSSTLNFDIYNVTNSNSIMSQNSSFDVWQEPEEIVGARFLKVGLQFDF
jgi:hypothetical protein